MVVLPEPRLPSAALLRPSCAAWLNFKVRCTLEACPSPCACSGAGKKSAAGGAPMHLLPPCERVWTTEGPGVSAAGGLVSGGGAPGPGCRRRRRRCRCRCRCCWCCCRRRCHCRCCSAAAAAAAGAAAAADDADDEGWFSCHMFGNARPKRARVVAQRTNLLPLHVQRRLRVPFVAVDRWASAVTLWPATRAVTLCSYGCHCLLGAAGAVWRSPILPLTAPQHKAAARAAWQVAAWQSNADVSASSLLVFCTSVCTLQQRDLQVRGDGVQCDWRRPHQPRCQGGAALWVSIVWGMCVLI